MQSIHELSTEEIYRLTEELAGEDLPPLDAVENEDWGRDFLLQRLSALPPDRLADRGLTWEPEHQGGS
jgi:hypothetical protein